MQAPGAFYTSSSVVMYKASQLGVSLPSELCLVPHVFKLQMGCLKNAFIEVQPPPHPKPK